MSGPEVETPRSALPSADLTLVERALRGAPEQLKDALQRVRPADLGRDLSRRSAVQVRQILRASDDRRAAAMLRAAHPVAAAKAMAACDPGHAGRLLSFIPTEHQVSILGALGAAARDAIEATLEPASRAQLQRLLAHPESAVARLMTPKIWRCDRRATAGQALEVLRANSGSIEVAQNCYVVEGERLVGVVALRELAIMPQGAAIDSLMTPEPISLQENAERSDAAEIIQTHDFLSLPVVDADGKLLGAVRVDDLLDAALSKVGTGLLNQGAVTGSIAGRLPYFLTPMAKVVQSRITWLILLFVAETATGTVLRHFENELAKVVALSFFIPLLIGTGGNAGSQTVSTLIRAMALGEVRAGDTLRVLLKEASTGLTLGVLLGSIAFGRALMWGVGYDLAGCVAVTVLIVCTWANTVGALIRSRRSALASTPRSSPGR